MGRLFWRRIWPRGTMGKRRRGERSQLLMATLVGLSAAIFLIWRFDITLRPQMIALGKTQIQNHLTYISSQTVMDVLAEQSIAYSDMVILKTGPGGEVQTMSIDAVKLNSFRSLVLERVTGQVHMLDSQDLGIPLGMLTGVDFMSALGPKLPIRVAAAASAAGQFRNEFLDAGINQTLHRVMLDISITATLLLPGGIAEVEVITPVCVTEAIIIGQVPQTYLNLNQ